MSATRLLRRAVESLTPFDIERRASYLALIKQSRRRDAWFSVRSQMQWLFDQEAIDLVVDVGANEGQFGAELRRFYSGELLSFEPVAAPFAKLAALAARDGGWKVFNFALGNHRHATVINVAADSRFSSLLTANDYSRHSFPGSRDDTQQQIEVHRIEDVLDREVTGVSGRRVFLKLDTQGYDLEVFRGLGHCLPSVAGLLSEVSLIPIYEGMPHWTDTIAAYEDAGFQVVSMFPVTRDRGRVIEFDCLMATSR